MIILAIDPGPTRSAYVLFDCAKMCPTVGTIVDNASLAYSLKDPQQRHAETSLVVEKVESYGMPVGAEVFETVYWTGRFIEAWESIRSMAFAVRIGRMTVKKALCHRTAGVNDAVIRQRLIDLYGGKDKAIGKKKKPGPLYWVKKDLWAALALAYVAASERSSAGACVQTPESASGRLTRSRA